MREKETDRMELYVGVAMFFFVGLIFSVVAHRFTHKKVFLLAGIPSFFLISFFAVVYLLYSSSWKNRRQQKYLEEVARNNLKIIRIISDFQPNIPVSLQRIAELAVFTRKDTEKIIKRILEKNPELGEYLALEQVFIRKIDTDSIIKELTTTCYYCGFPLEKEGKICPDCGKEALYCSVCKLPISFGEEVGMCSLCEAKGHLVHLQEWLKTNGKCPVCLQELPLEGIVVLEPFEKKKRKEG